MTQVAEMPDITDIDALSEVSYHTEDGMESVSETQPENDASEADTDASENDTAMDDEHQQQHQQQQEEEEDAKNDSPTLEDASYYIEHILDEIQEAVDLTARDVEHYNEWTEPRHPYLVMLEERMRAERIKREEEEEKKREAEKNAASNATRGARLVFYWRA